MYPYIRKQLTLLMYLSIDRGIPRNSNTIYNICNVRSFTIHTITYIIDLNK